MNFPELNMGQVSKLFGFTYKQVRECFKDTEHHEALLLRDDFNTKHYNNTLSFKEVVVAKMACDLKTMGFKRQGIKKVVESYMVGYGSFKLVDNGITVEVDYSKVEQAVKDAVKDD